MNARLILAHCNTLASLTTAVMALLASAPASNAEVKLPRVFGSHMVLQQQKPLIIWGWADPGESVGVQLGNTEVKVTANQKGEWKVSLPAMPAGGPHTLTVSGSSTVTCEDVMIGEVWICSGQSNMEMGIGSVRDGKQEIASANFPLIRLLMVPNKWMPEPQKDIEPTAWKVCTPENIASGGWGGFSAAGYFFGRELHSKLGVAIGLVDATWGGTCAQSWTPPEGFAQVPELQNEYTRVLLANPATEQRAARLDQFLSEMSDWLAAAREAKDKQTFPRPMPAYPAELLPANNVQSATALYNGMIHPLAPFPIRGAIWYQGESNLDEGLLYALRMKALITGWRKVWNQDEFPFFFVQIAPYNYGGDAERIGLLWEGQTVAANTVPNSGMVVINDIGDLKDIHPANKQDVGRRLSLWALAKTYGSNVVCAGPTFQSLKAEGEKMRVQFANTAGGLVSRDAQPLNWFEIIDAEEGGFVRADAQVDGDSVLLSSAEVKKPVAVRFAWNMLAEPNLANKAGLPAGAFRAGTIPKRDYLTMKVPESKQYQLVYDLDLNTLGSSIKWATDNSSQIKTPIQRVAYFLELQAPDGSTKYAYASFDAFTSSLGQIGVPTAGSGARFQQKVSNLNVYSNVKGVVTGTNLNGGYIEFWPNNYGVANSANVANASGTVYDFGDEPAEPADGYGSMQIHNTDAKQTIIAVNHWREGERADIGIGNQNSGNPDWTFAANAGSYKTKRLRILVK